MKNRNSELQKMILGTLSQHPGMNVSRIAQEIERQRSSVSRSLGILANRDLVSKVGGAYRIVEKNAETISRMIERDRQMFQAARLLADNPLAKAAAENSFINLGEKVRQAMLPVIDPKVVSGALMRPYSEIIERAVKGISTPLIRAAGELTISADALVRVKTLDLDLASVYANMSFISGVHGRVSDQLASKLSETVKSLGSLITAAAKVDDLLPSVEWAIPTVSNALSVASWEIREEQDDFPDGIPSYPALLFEDRVDKLLDRVHTGFSDLRRGAWRTFDQKGPDNERQACQSMRALLVQVVDLASSGSGDTRKQRVRNVLGSKSEAELVEALAQTVDEIWARLSAHSHRAVGAPYHRTSVEYALATAQNTIAYILMIKYDEMD